MASHHRLFSPRGGGGGAADHGGGFPSASPGSAVAGGEPPSGVALTGTVNEMKNELERLHKENFNLKMTIFYMEEKVQRLMGGEMDMSDRTRELEEQVVTLECEKYELDKSLIEAEKRCEEYEKLLARSKQELTHLHSSQMESTVQYKEANSRGDKLEAEYQSIQQETIRLKDSNNWLESRCHEYEEDLDKSRAEIQHKEAQLEEAERVKRRYESEVASLKQELQREKQRLQEAVKTTSEFVHSEERYKKTVEELQNTQQKVDLALTVTQEKEQVIKEQEEQIYELRSEVERLSCLQSELEEARDTIRTLEGDTQRSRREWEIQMHEKDLELRRTLTDNEAKARQMLNQTMTETETKAKRQLVEMEAKARELRESRDKTLMDLSDVRHAHDKKLEALYAELSQFDQGLVAAISELHKTTTNHVVGAPRTNANGSIFGEEDLVGPSTGGRATGPGDGEAPVAMKIKLLIDQWKKMVKKLPALGQAVITKHEEETNRLMQIVSEQASRIKQAEENVERLKGASNMNEAQHRSQMEDMESTMFMELEKSQRETEMVKSKLEKLQVEAQREKESIRQGYEAQMAAQRERWESEVAKTRAMQEDLKSLHNSVDSWRDGFQQEKSRAEEARRKAEREMVLAEEEKKRADAERERVEQLLREKAELMGVINRQKCQLVARDEQLSLYAESLSGKKLNQSLGAVSSGDREDSDLREVLLRAMDESRSLIRSHAEEVEGQRQQYLLSKGGGIGGREADAIRAELSCRMDQLKRYIQQLQQLYEGALDCSRRYQAARQQQSSLVGADAARPRYLNHLDDEVSKLLSENVKLIGGFQQMCKDLQKLYNRLKGLGAGSSSTSPVKSRGGFQENDRNLVNTPGSGRGPRQEGERKAWAAVPVVVSASGGGVPSTSVVPVGYSSSRALQPAPSTSTYLATRASTMASKPIANLEKISADLQEIARKLEHYQTSSSIVKH